MGIKFYDSNGKYWGEYDETRSLFIPSEETVTQAETQNSNLTFEKRTMCDCYNCKRYETEDECIECHYEPKDEPQTDEEYINNLPWTEVGNGEQTDEPQTDCAWK